MTDGDNKFYQMDDDYIERTYVRAEEERQIQEAERQRQLAIEEQEAFQKAERQRIAADAERQKRKEEADAVAALEAAKAKREEEDSLRREKEKEYQDRLNKIEEELAAMVEKKKGFVTEKNALIIAHSEEEKKIKDELDEVREKKREILEQEALIEAKLQGFEGRAKGQVKAIEQDQKNTGAREKALAQERRAVQTEMLEFLKDPSKFLNKPDPIPEPSFKPNAAPANPNPMYPMGSMYPTRQPPMMQPNHNVAAVNPMYPNNNPGPVNHYVPPQPMPGPGYPTGAGGYMPPPTSFNGNFQPGQVTQIKPDYPTFDDGSSYKPKPNPTPSAPPAQANNSSNGKSDLSEQLAMLEDFYQQGIMGKEEYEHNKQEALKAAGVDPNMYKSSVGTGNPEVDRQIAQLDQYLKDGVLQQTEYEEAKQRVLEDAGLKPSGGRGNTGSNNNVHQHLPTASVAKQNVVVAVTMPYNRRPGENMTINYQGREFSVRIPVGVKPGNKFHASLPV